MDLFMFHLESEMSPQAPVFEHLAPRWAAGWASGLADRHRSISVGLEGYKTDLSLPDTSAFLTVGQLPQVLTIIYRIYS